MVDGLAAILADDQGLGKTATAVAFIQALRHEFKVCGPMLVVVPQSALGFWEGEFTFWAGQGCNVVPYAGSTAARALIHDHELWLQPGSLDHRNSSTAINEKAPRVALVSSPLPSDLSLVAWLPLINNITVRAVVHLGALCTLLDYILWFVTSCTKQRPS